MTKLVLFLDDGGVMNENRRRAAQWQRLVEAIRAIQDDFQKVLVITHVPEMKDAFPVRIEVRKTPRGSRFQVV
jgi:exonuclease SbcC